MRTTVLLLMLVPALLTAPTVWAQKKADPPKKAEPAQKSQLSSYMGKSLDEWIAEIGSRDRSRGEVALRAVMLFGPEQAQRAVPAILKELNKHRPPNNHIDAGFRTDAVIVLGEIVSAEEASDKHVEEAVGVLTKLLKDSQVLVRYHAALALAKIGPEAVSATANLMTLTKDPDTWKTRQAAVTALGRVAFDRKKGPNVNVIATLYDRLDMKKEPVALVRLAAIQALTYLGPPVGETARLQMERLLDGVANTDTEPGVRIWAHMSVISIKGKPEPARLSLIGKMLTHRDPAVRGNAAQALGILGMEAKGQVQQLIQALEDEDKSVAALSMMALSRMGRWADEAVPHLQKIAKNNELPEPFRRMAEQAIDGIKGKDKTPEKK